MTKLLDNKIQAIKLALKWLKRQRFTSVKGMLKMYVSHILTCRVEEIACNTYLVRMDKFTKQKRKTLASAC
jgi:hypothetical protein